MSLNNIFEATGPDYKNYNKPTRYDIMAAQAMINAARTICSIASNGSMCIEAKKDACDTIKTHIISKVPDLSGVAYLLGHEDISFLGCTELKIC